MTNISAADPKIGTVSVTGNEIATKGLLLHAPANQGVGLLLLDGSFNPTACNDEAIQILIYPEVPDNIKPLDPFLRDTLRTRLLDGQSSHRPSFVTEFLSGRRSYRCRLFRLNWQVKGASQSAVQLLLERSPSGFDFLARTAQQFKFSRREQQAVELLLQGLSNKEIAERMKISPNTVNTFFRLVMTKMGVSNRSGILGKMIPPARATVSQFSARAARTRRQA